MASHGLSIGRPEVDDDYLNMTAASANVSTIHSRAVWCELNTATVTDTTQVFVDWDVQMSPVVEAVTSGGMDIWVVSGYSVSNSVSVSAGVDATAVAQQLHALFNIEYSKTWTTQTMVEIKGTVPDGYSGVMITRPWKTRKYGRTLKGCVGSMTQTGTFMADSYSDGSYSGLKWISGTISMCVKKEFPLTRCEGSGYFI